MPRLTGSSGAASKNPGRECDAENRDLVLVDSETPRPLGHRDTFTSTTTEQLLHVGERTIGDFTGQRVAEQLPERGGDRVWGCGLHDPVDIGGVFVAERAWVSRARKYADWFDFAEADAVLGTAERDSPKRAEFKRFEPDFVYLYRAARSVTVGQLCELADATSRRGLALRAGVP